MPTISTESIRTIALVGHANCGKTTLTEALLHHSGAIPAMGSVEKGSTVSDFDPLEKEHGHSLNAAVVHFTEGDTRIHLIDTPGYPDFMGQAMGALEAVETAAVLINAQNGIEMIASRMMQWAHKRNLCRMVIVNKIDAENLDLPKLLNDLREAFGKECLPINLPAGNGSRVVDCFFNPSGESDFSSVAEVHRMLVDQVVEVDEDLMAVYLEQGEVAPEQLHAPFEKALREGHIVPVCFVSARTGAGVKELLDVIVKLMPNPAEGNPPLFVNGEGEAAVEFHSEPDPSKHVLAHVFKVTVDPYVGKLGVFRVHQGTVTKDTQLYIGDGRKPFKVGHVFMLRGKEHVEVEACVPGDICAVAKAEDVHYDAVLHDAAEDAHIHLRPLEFPHPIYGLAIQPKRRGDEQRLSDILHKLQAEDPCFRVEHVASTNETIVRGLGDLHLRCMLEKMRTHYGMEIEARPPRIEYRETITGKAEGHSRHKKQTGGAGQFGEVFLKVEPLERGTGFEFVDQVKGGVIPNQYIPAVEKGVRQVLETGYLAGYPLEDLRVIVYDGKSHPVDSKEVAFISAGRKAFLDALEKARPIILEPIVNIEIHAPEANMGDITGDLSSRRGQVSGTDTLRGGMVSITGVVPLAELSSYQSRLKSLTGGHGTYQLDFSHYEPAPPNIQAQLKSEFKVKREED
ncbi:MAG TPA: elongation factor G [Burkholderiales bacterium]|nr:elongation factor G [Burkholderiales bacterium]